MRIVWLFVYLASVHSAIVKRNEGIPVSGQRTANLLALAKRDNARAANLVSRLEAPIDLEQEPAIINDTVYALSPLASVQATNQAVYYTVQVQLGDGPKTHEMMLDTGSSVSWVKNYTVSNTTVTSDAVFSTRYGLGSIEGQVVYDTMRVGALEVTNQAIGAISQSVDMDVNGLLGLGPSELAQGTFTSGVVVSTMVETLLEQGQIQQSVYQLDFQPTNDLQATNGWLTLGEASEDSSTVAFSRSSHLPYWGVDDWEMRLGDQSILKDKSGIIDSGTTLILLASAAFEAFVSILDDHGGIYDESVELYRVPSANVRQIDSLYFGQGNNEMELISDALFFPESLTSALGGEGEWRFTIVSELGSAFSDLSFILGMKVLERYSVAFDETRASIAFTPTSDTYLTYAQLGGNWTEPAVSSASMMRLARQTTISWTLLCILTGFVT